MWIHIHYVICLVLSLEVAVLSYVQQASELHREKLHLEANTSDSEEQSSSSSKRPLKTINHHHHQVQEIQKEQHFVDHMIPRDYEDNDEDLDTEDSSFSSKFNKLFNRNHEYLNESLVTAICSLDRGSSRFERMNRTYLSHCKRHKLERIMSNQILMSVMHKSGKECTKILSQFITLDELIAEFNEIFSKTLSRYDCDLAYSVKWNCNHCREAYIDWLCTTNLPYYMNGERVKPCLSFCRRVEQRCPYFQPMLLEQYGGQPLFMCRGPQIPIIYGPKVSYSPRERCYDMCHLYQHQTEIKESENDLLSIHLSEYNQRNCPSGNSIVSEMLKNPDHHCLRSSISSKPGCKLISNFATNDDEEQVHLEILRELGDILFEYQVKRND